MQVEMSFRMVAHRGNPFLDQFLTTAWSGRTSCPASFLLDYRSSIVCRWRVHVFKKKSVPQRNVNPSFSLGLHNSSSKMLARIIISPNTLNRCPFHIRPPPCCSLSLSHPIFFCISAHLSLYITTYKGSNVKSTQYTNLCKSIHNLIWIVYETCISWASHVDEDNLTKFQVSTLLSRNFTVLNILFGAWKDGKAIT